MTAVLSKVNGRLESPGIAGPGGPKRLRPSGDTSAVAPPVPIPNTEVKRCSPDGSASLGCARVGRCQNLWVLDGESRPRPFLFPRPRHALFAPCGWVAFLQLDRVLPAQRKGVGERAMRDVCAGGIHAQVKAISEELCGAEFFATGAWRQPPTHQRAHDFPGRTRCHGRHAFRGSVYGHRSSSQRGSFPPADRQAHRPEPQHHPARSAPGASGFFSSPRPSKLEPFHPYLRERFLQHGLSAIRLTQEIIPMGFRGSVQIVRRFLHTLKTSPSSKLTVRFETPPGEQAQAHWAELGRFTSPSGEPIRLYTFVIVLSFSRMLYAEFTRSMRIETLIRCHQNAFAFFGGWPRHILYDNMRQVAAGPQRINPRFRDFADHHGFAVRTHRPYRPRTKGKVERMAWTPPRPACSSRSSATATSATTPSSSLPTKPSPIGGRSSPMTPSWPAPLSTASFTVPPFSTSKATVTA